MKLKKLKRKSLKREAKINVESDILNVIVRKNM